MMEKYTQKFHSQHFSDDALVNARIKSEAWFDVDAGLVINGMTFIDLKKPSP